MKQKQLVYDAKLGRYVERYVDRGPGRARPGHGAPTVSLHNKEGDRCGSMQLSGGRQG